MEIAFWLWIATLFVIQPIDSSQRRYAEDRIITVQPTEAEQCLKYW
jgi:hypothetical protein